VGSHRVGFIQIRERIAVWVRFPRLIVLPFRILRKHEGIGELRMVERVEEFGAELDCLSLRDLGRFQCVPVVDPKVEKARIE
jgi:hypothetical protein